MVNVYANAIMIIYMWHIYIYIYIYGERGRERERDNMFAIVGLFDTTNRCRERKREWYRMNSIKILCICVGRWHNKTQWQLLNTRGRREKIRDCKIIINLILVHTVWTFPVQYMNTVLGNLLILLAISSDPHIHTPMSLLPTHSWMTSVLSPL
jgi:hypothetical protein